MLCALHVEVVAAVEVAALAMGCVMRWWQVSQAKPMWGSLLEREKPTDPAPFSLDPALLVMMRTALAKFTFRP